MIQKIRMPGDLAIPTRFFGRFTWKDLLRLGIPLLIGVAVVYQQSKPDVGSIGVLVAVGAIGFGWYVFTPFDQHLDVLVYNAIRWLFEKRSGEVVSVEERNQDYLLLENGTVVGVIEVEPTNLEMKTEAEQAALHAIYKELFDTVSFSVSIYSRQEPLDLTEYTEFIEEQSSADEVLKEDYLGRCDELANGDLSSTHHYLVLRVQRDPVSWVQSRLPDWMPIETAQPDEGIQAAVDELDNRCRDVVQALDSSELTVERITGQHLHRISRHVASDATSRFTPLYTLTPYNETIGEYRRTIYISEFPSSLDLGWTLQLLRVNGLVDITQVVHPQNSGKTTKKLRRLSEKLNAEIGSLHQYGYGGNSRLRRLLDDVEWFLELIADREDRPVEYAAYVTVHSEDKERCQQTLHQVQNRLQTLQIDYREPVFRTDQAFYTDSILHEDRLDETMLMPASSAAGGFPFATQDTVTTNGILYGVDKSDGTPVLLDRYSWSSHSMARMGMVGSGKSYAAKIELLRAGLAYDDIKIIVVDPKQEYHRVLKKLGGTIHELDRDSEYSLDGDVVGFRVTERGKEENVELLADVVEHIYSEVSQDQRRTLVLVDEARILLNDERGRRVLNRFVLEGRDTNTAITLLTQNASHFTHSREGREILDNMPGKMFMRHDRVPESVVDYFELSDREKQELFELRTGTDSDYSEALLRVSGRLDTRVRIESTTQEHVLIESGEESV